MTATVPLGEARDHLSQLADEVERTHERVTITRHGRPSVVLISAEDLEGLEETLDILSDPDALRQIREAEAEIDRGEYAGVDDLKKILEERRARETNQDQ